MFCLKEPLDEKSQQFLCGVFNSFVANYLVRLRVSTHVTSAIVARLPVPRPAAADPVFQKVTRLSRGLARRFDQAAFARLKGSWRSFMDSRGSIRSRPCDVPAGAATERAAALAMFTAQKV